MIKDQLLESLITSEVLGKHKRRSSYLIILLGLSEKGTTTLVRFTIGSIK